MSATWWMHTGGQLSKLKTSRHAVPVVVIDPEDAEDFAEATLRHIEAKLALDEDDRGYITDAVAHALREFAAPTPPKPAEPQGLGAVVEDAEGVKWVRLGFTHIPWRHETERDVFQPWRSYGYIAAVRVLSEGVTP